MDYGFTDTDIPQLCHCCKSPVGKCVIGRSIKQVVSASRIRLVNMSRVVSGYFWKKKSCFWFGFTWHIYVSAAMSMANFKLLTLHAGSVNGSIWRMRTAEEETSPSIPVLFLFLFNVLCLCFFLLDMLVWLSSVTESKYSYHFLVKL